MNTTTDRHVMVPATPRNDGKRAGRRIVSVIGIDSYQHLRPLENAVADANGVRELLLKKFGFVEVTPPIFDEMATHRAIRKLVLTTLREQLNPDDELILFVAGHGVIDSSSTPPTSYLAPVDAAADEWEQCINIGHWLEEVSRLPPRYILVILDACHTGLALSRLIKNFRDGVRRSPARLAKKGRKIFSSADQDQPAQDGGPIPGHSLFTSYLLHALNTGAADTNDDSTVTDGELFQWVTEHVRRESRDRQTPKFGVFFDDEDGEFAFDVDRGTKSLRDRAKREFERGDLSALESTLEKWGELHGASIYRMLWRFRLHMASGEFSEAQTTLSDALETHEQHASLNVAHNVLPVDKKRLEVLRWKLAQWDRLLSHRRTERELSVEFLVGDEHRSLAQADIAASSHGEERLCCPLDHSYQLKILNRSSQERYVYLLTVGADGDFNVHALWKLTGTPLRPDETRKSDIWVNHSLGPFELHLYTSSERVGELAAPPAAAASRPVQIPDLTLAGVRSLRIPCIGTPADPDSKRTTGGLIATTVASSTLDSAATQANMKERPDFDESTPFHRRVLRALFERRRLALLPLTAISAAILTYIAINYSPIFESFRDSVEQIRISTSGPFGEAAAGHIGPAGETTDDTDGTDGTDGITSSASNTTTFWSEPPSDTGATTSSTNATSFADVGADESTGENPENGVTYGQKMKRAKGKLKKSIREKCGPLTQAITIKFSVGRNGNMRSPVVGDSHRLSVQEKCAEDAVFGSRIKLPYRRQGSNSEEIEIAPRQR